MKIGIVPSSMITAAKGLDASAYVDPCADIDAAIARTERTIELAQARLVNLRAERDRRMVGDRVVRRGWDGVTRR